MANIKLDEFFFYFEWASKFDSFDVSTLTEILFLRVLVTIELHCSLLTVRYHELFESGADILTKNVKICILTKRWFLNSVWLKMIIDPLLEMCRNLFISDKLSLSICPYFVCGDISLDFLLFVKKTSFRDFLNIILGYYFRSTLSICNQLTSSSESLLRFIFLSVWNHICLILSNLSHHLGVLAVIKEFHPPTATKILPRVSTITIELKNCLYI